MRRVADGDRYAFGRLYEATASCVYGLSLHLLGCSDGAATLVVESYREVWDTATRFAPDRESAVAWIMAIVHRRGGQKVRAAAKRATNLRAGPAPTVSWSMPTCKALVALPPAQREALELAYFQCRSRTEVAALTSVAPSVVGSRLQGGLMGLRGLVIEPSEVAISPRPSRARWWSHSSRSPLPCRSGVARPEGPTQ